MDEINAAFVRKRYNEINEIWSEDDKWHYKTFKQIRKFIDGIFEKSITQKQVILNAGSGGNSYGFDEEMLTNIDVAESKNYHYKNFIQSSIEKIPIENKQFDAIICVGSVLNYCDPIKVLNEFNRLLTLNGKMVLEFESSNTFELLGTENFNKRVVLAKTFYAGNQEIIWYYSEDYIREVLTLLDLKVTKYKRWHILSPLINRIIKSPNISSYFSNVDFIFRRIPYINRLCSNVIFLIERNNTTKIFL